MTCSDFRHNTANIILVLSSLERTKFLELSNARQFKQKVGYYFCKRWQDYYLYVVILFLCNIWQIFVKAHLTTTTQNPLRCMQRIPFPFFACIITQPSSLPSRTLIAQSESVYSDRKKALMYYCAEVRDNESSHKRYGSHKMGLLFFSTAERNKLNERGPIIYFRGGYYVLTQK